MTGTNTPELGFDIDSAIASLLAPEESEAPPEEAEVTEGKSPKAPEAAITEESKGSGSNLDDQEDETEDEPEDTPEEEPEDEEEDESDGDEESDDEEEAGETDEEPEEEEVLYTLPSGEQVTLEELKRGHLRQADYTQKTQALAEERKQVEETAARIGQERQVLAENLNVALNVIEPQLAELAKTDWQKLASEDAYEYAEKRALFDQATARYNQIVSAAQQVVQAQQAQTSENFRMMVDQEQKALAMAIPDIADPKVGPKLRHQIKEYATDVLGISEQEASSIVDHRVIVALHKAMQYDQLNESTLQAAKKRVAKTPKKVIKPGKPVTRSERKTHERNERLGRLRQTGSEDDAVAFLLS